MQRPLPIPTPESTAFWDGCMAGELRIQKCKDCLSHQFYPRIFCSKCGSTKIEWVRAEGRGSIYTWTVMRRPPSEAFAADVPYILALVQLPEGVRMMARITGCDTSAVRAGMPVSVRFREVSPSIALPEFIPEER